jgi:hypothetical protein
VRLGELIDTLERMPHEAQVVFDSGEEVGIFGSWRGVYAEMTLFTNPRGPSALSEADRTVAAVLARARAADGGTFTGYKGGEYKMDRRSPVWADDYGECRYRGIMGLALESNGEGRHRVVIKTADLSDYRD